MLLSTKNVTWFTEQYKEKHKTHEETQDDLNKKITSYNATSPSNKTSIH